MSLDKTLLVFLTAVSLPVLAEQADHASSPYPDDLILHVTASLEDNYKYSLQSIQYFYDYTYIVKHISLEEILTPVVLPWDYDDKPVMMTTLNLWDDAKNHINSTCTFYWGDQYISNWMDSVDVNIFHKIDGEYSWNACELTDTI